MSIKKLMYFPYIISLAQIQIRFPQSGNNKVEVKRFHIMIDGIRILIGMH